MAAQAGLISSANADTQPVDQTANATFCALAQLMNNGMGGALPSVVSSCSSVPDNGAKNGVPIPPDASTVVAPSSDDPGQDPSAQTRVVPVASDQGRLADSASENGQAGDTSTAVGQKLPTTDMPPQANSASTRPGLSASGGPPSTETSGAQAPTTSNHSQNASGTSIAKDTEVMKSNDSSELRSYGLTSAQPRAATDKASLPSSHQADPSATSLENGRLAPGTVAALETPMTLPTASTTDVPQITRGSIMEVVLHGISDQILEFKKLGADSMAVLLKPDDKTEIYLSVKSQSGHTEVSARLNAGDADLLNEHWGEIKSALAKQGITLSDLETENARPHYGSTSWGRRQNQSPESQSENPQQQQNPGRREMPEFISNIKSFTDPLQARWAAPALAAAKRLWVVWL
jgi:hypothetical protein